MQENHYFCDQLRVKLKTWLGNVLLAYSFGTTNPVCSLFTTQFQTMTGREMSSILLACLDIIICKWLIVIPNLLQLKVWQIYNCQLLLLNVREVFNNSGQKRNYIPKINLNSLAISTFFQKSEAFNIKPLVRIFTKKMDGSQRSFIKRDTPV